MVKKKLKKHSVLPGFGLTMGFTVVYLSLIVLIPLAVLFLHASGMGWSEYWKTVTEPRVLASFRVTFSLSFLAAMTNAVFGFIVAWVLSRYTFPGRRFIDALVDLPFALPTAASGITLSILYSNQGTKRGWIGQLLPFEVLDTQIGIFVALTFIGLPFVVRAMQPAIDDIERELEEVSASLGASRWQTFWKVLFPTLLPALLTGFTMAFARAIGEYGSVIFISGKTPFLTEITPVLIVTRLEENDVNGAAVIATTMLIISFLLLFVINMLQLWGTRKYRETR